VPENPSAQTNWAWWQFDTLFKQSIKRAIILHLLKALSTSYGIYKDATIQHIDMLYIWKFTFADIAAKKKGGPTWGRLKKGRRRY